MNEGIWYTTPNRFYALPEIVTASGVDSDAAVSVLSQPIIGEEGFNPRGRPRTIELPATFAVTFENNVHIPSGLALSVRYVIVGVLGMVAGDNGSTPFDATQVGQGAFQQFYGYPLVTTDPVADRRGRRIHTTTIYVRWDSLVGFPGNRTISFTLTSGYKICFMRATYKATTP